MKATKTKPPVALDRPKTLPKLLPANAGPSAPSKPRHYYCAKGLPCVFCERPDLYGTPEEQAAGAAAWRRSTGAR